MSMDMVIIWSYFLVGFLSGFSALAWKYFYSSAGEIRGDDLVGAFLFIFFWPVVLIVLGVVVISEFTSHDRVILRRKK